MKRTNCASLAAALLLLLGMGPGALAADTASLRGVVKDQLGAAIDKATVELLRDGRTVATTTTDSQGAFQFSSLAAGRYDVHAVAEGFTALTKPSVYVGGQSAAQLDMTLSVGPLAQEIVVSATGTAVPTSQVGSSISVIGQDQLQNATEVLDPLRSVPGVTILQTGQRGGTTSLFIRGGDSGANKVLVDGVPLNDIGGIAEFADVAATGVDQIEIQRNPNSVLYGSDALAGVVSLTTRRGVTPLPELSYAFDAGNFNTLRHDGSVAGAYRQLDYFSEFSRFDTQNSIPNDSFHNATFAGNLGWTPISTLDVRLTVRHSQSATGAPNAIEAFGIPDNAFQRTQNTYIGATLQHQTTSRWHNLVRYGASRLDSQFDDVSPAGIPSPFGDGNFLGKTLTLHGANGFSTTGQAILDFAGTFPILSSSSSQRDFVYTQSDYSFSPRLLALFGFRYEDERGFTLAGGTKTPTQRNNFSYTSEFQANLGRAYATVGMGIENNAVFGVAVTPRVSLTYYLVRPRTTGLFTGTRLRFNYAQGVKEPSIFEQTSSLFNLLSQLPNGPQLISQFHIGPVSEERSRSYDGGIEQSFWNSRAKLGATIFYNQFAGQVEFVGNTALPLLGVPAPIAASVLGATLNSEALRSLGAETELEFNLGRGFSARAAYTYLDAVVQRSFSSDQFFPSVNPEIPGVLIGAFSPLVGNRPFRQPPHTASFLLRYTMPRYAFSLKGLLVSRSDDSTFLTDAAFGNTMLLPNRNLAPSYQKIDFNGSYRLNRWMSLYAGVENLASEHYAPAFGFPALPLTFRAGSRITFGGESWK